MLVLQDKLRWDWEVEVPALDTSVFIIPGARVKNGDDRLVVFNSVARSVVQARRASLTHRKRESLSPVGTWYLLLAAVQG